MQSGRRGRSALWHGGYRQPAMASSPIHAARRRRDATTSIDAPDGGTAMERSPQSGDTIGLRATAIQPHSLSESVDQSRSRPVLEWTRRTARRARQLLTKLTMPPQPASRRYRRRRTDRSNREPGRCTAPGLDECVATDADPAATDGWIHQPWLGKTTIYQSYVAGL